MRDRVVARRRDLASIPVAIIVEERNNGREEDGAEAECAQDNQETIQERQLRGSQQDGS